MFCFVQHIVFCIFLFSTNIFAEPAYKYRSFLNIKWTRGTTHDISNNTKENKTTLIAANERNEMLTFSFPNKSGLYDQKKNNIFIEA